MNIKDGDKINILGTEYTFKIGDDHSECFKGCDGFILYRQKLIVISDMSTYQINKDYTDKDIFLKRSQNHALRHEILHAFFYESGLWDAAGKYSEAWPINEEMVDWFSIQSPKIFKLYEELDILED